MTTTVKVETPRCSVCRETTIMEVDEASFHTYRNGAHVQHAFPNLSADDRELLISGTHPACWDTLWSDDDDD